MKASYDFSNAKRGAVIPAKGKTRVTIWIDDVVLENFRARANAEGKGYQTLINEALGATMRDDKPLTAAILCRVIREELQAA